MFKDVETFENFFVSTVNTELKKVN